MNEPRRLRCAVYTRVSTDEGLAQAYTSIDAQRDAGEAYIVSRRSEGWVQVSDYYDDGGFSGGSLERPALQRLIADMKAGKVDVVVAYKLDRLSRSLFDFAELVKLFEAHNVTFVSVTQHFNTTDAMGRMLLNILLTFAQFEQELTAERIRDKFIASKRKGYWMHGVPPLGYDVRERRLEVNEDEGALVRWVFRRFLEVRSIQKVAEDARALNYLNKSWTSARGNFTEGKVLDKSSIHKILHNRSYLGHMKHRDIEFADTHPAVIDVDLWEQVHRVLAVNATARGNETRASIPFLLKGLVYAPDGRALIPWHTTKRNGQLYRYYLTRELLDRGRLSESPLPRLPASELEDIVLEQLRRVLQRPELVQEVIVAATAKDPTLDEAKVTVAMRRLDRVWDALFPEEQKRLFHQLIEKVVVTPDAVEVRLHSLGTAALSHEFATEDAWLSP